MVADFSVVIMMMFTVLLHQFTAHLFGHRQAIHIRHIHITHHQLDSRVSFELGYAVSAVHSKGQVQAGFSTHCRF
jgi:hypothetical protein